MVTYVGLMSFTDKGIQGIKDTTKRAAAAREVTDLFRSSCTSRAVRKARLLILRGIRKSAR